MSGLEMNSLTREQVAAAVSNDLAESGRKFYVWDGTDDDDRPATTEELQAGLAEAKRKRGRPAGASKTSVSLRIDTDVLEIFRATGKGWQSRLNAALRMAATELRLK